MSRSPSLVLIALTEIYEGHGFLTPAVVVDEAANPKHPLHDRFEWDDQEAAREYRLVQAGALIRSVKLRIVEPEVSEIRAFVNVPAQTPGEQGHYVPESVVRADPAMQAIVLQTMNREWRSMQRRYQSHRQFWDLVNQTLEAQRVAAAALEAAAETG